jgi:hypothetical protein
VVIDPDGPLLPPLPPLPPQPTSIEADIAMAARPPIARVRESQIFIVISIQAESAL